MKLAIIGGVGYVGYNVIPKLVDAGHEVVVLARRSSVARRPGVASVLEKAGARIITGDSVDDNLLLNSAADVYINMAGAIDRPAKALWDAHVEVTNRMVRAASHYGSRAVYTSAVAAVGTIPGAPRGSEVQDGDPKRTRGVPESVYEETKARGEDVVAEAEELRGRWCILRPGLVLGRNPSHVEWRLLSISLKMRLAPSLGWDAPVTHYDDLARAYLACSEGSLDGLAVHAVSYHVDIGVLASRACDTRGLRCARIPLGPTIRAVGPLAPGTSRLKLVYLLYKRGYRYVSSYTERIGIPATTLDDAVELVASEILG